MKTTAAIKTLVTVVKSKINFVNHHETFLKEKFNIIPDSDKRELLHVYWLSKFHKNPSKCTFIVAATRFLAKLFPKAVTSSLKFSNQ